MHGLGPHNLTVNGRQTTVRQELKETYSALEEAKADISGLFAIQHMIDKGVMPKSLERIPLHDLSGVGLPVDPVRRQRSARPRHRDPAELPCSISGGVVVNADGTFRVDPGRIKEGVAALTRDIMTIQAEGDYAKAKALGDRMGVVRPEVQKVLDKLASIPVDIEPQFKTADLLLSPVK